MLKTKVNKIILSYQKAHSKKLISKIQFEIELEEGIKANRLEFKEKV